jgi:hypothetical protein
MQAPPPPSGPLIFNHSYNDDYLPLRYPVNFLIVAHTDHTDLGVARSGWL